MASDASTAAALAACSDAQRGMDNMARYAVQNLNHLTERRSFSESLGEGRELVSTQGGLNQNKRFLLFHRTCLAGVFSRIFHRVLIGQCCG